MSLKLKAKSYKCRFLEPGVSTNCGVSVLVRADNLMALAEKFKGVPISVTHDDLTNENVDNYKAGIIANVYKGDDGWAWAEFLVDNEEGERLLSQGYNISCAYTVMSRGAGGEHNGVEYDFEVLDLQADHIAIVDVPHYTDAIVVKNSINIKPKIKNMFKFMKSKNKTEALKNSIEEKEEVFVKNGDDKINVEDLINKYREVKNKESKSGQEEEALILGDDDEVDVDGKMVSVKDLVKTYNECGEDKKEKEDRLRDAEKDDAAHIDYLERDMKDDAKARKKLENSEDRDEEEDHYRGAEKDDAAHIRDLEEDMKDDSRARKKLENSEDKEEEEDHYRGAEKDDAAHIRDLEEDMKDDAKKRKKIENSKTSSDFDNIKNARKEFLDKNDGQDLPVPNFYKNAREIEAGIQKIYGSSK